jgi:hypothetical protein
MSSLLFRYGTVRPAFFSAQIRILTAVMMFDLIPIFSSSTGKGDRLNYTGLIRGAATAKRVQTKAAYKFLNPAIEGADVCQKPAHQQGLWPSR